MLAASPITRQTVGRTFIVAISFLGAIAAVQLSVIVYAFVARAHLPPANVATLGDTQPGSAVAPAEDTDFAADPLKDPAKIADAAATEVAALTPPKPTPLPARSPSLPEPE